MIKGVLLKTKNPLNVLDVQLTKKEQCINHLPLLDRGEVSFILMSLLGQACCALPESWIHMYLQVTFWREVVYLCIASFWDKKNV